MSGDVFDDPSSWRRAAIAELGLDGEDRIAGAVTGAGYPDALEPIVDAIAPGSTAVLDVGAGLGAAAEWVRRRTRRPVVALEPEPAAVDAATALFPSLHVVRADAARVPLRTGTAAAVTLLGMISLTPDPDRVLAEAARCGGDSTVIGVSDLFATGEAPLRHGPNVFPTADSVRAICERLGFATTTIWTPPPELTTRWDPVAERVAATIERRHGHEPAFRTWARDQRRLADLLDSGAVAIATIVTRRGP